MASYETFASIYDEVMDSEVYLDWLNFTQRHVPNKSAHVLELACGTGILSVELANAGYKVTGLDLSKDMIKMANERVSPEDEMVSFKEGNMLELTEKNAYDAVTCYSDSLCYMANETEVETVFQGVHAALKDDGLFLFDVHSIFQMEIGYEEYSYHYQTDDFAFLWESYPGEHLYSVEHFLTFFVSKGDLFERHDELHEERTYPIETYVDLLKKVGFKDIQIGADFKDNSPEDDSKRWFFVCRK